MSIALVDGLKKQQSKGFYNFARPSTIEKLKSKAEAHKVSEYFSGVGSNDSQLKREQLNHFYIGLFEQGLLVESTIRKLKENESYTLDIRQEKNQQLIQPTLQKMVDFFGHWIKTTRDDFTKQKTGLYNVSISGLNRTGNDNATLIRENRFKELRDYLHALPDHKTKSQYVKEAMESGNIEPLQAVTSAPYPVIDRSTVDRFNYEYAERAYPQAIEQLYIKGKRAHEVAQLSSKVYGQAVIALANTAGWSEKQVSGLVQSDEISIAHSADSIARGLRLNEYYSPYHLFDW